jgi:hypothetical protein
MIRLLGPPANGAITSIDAGSGIPTPAGSVPPSADSRAPASPLRALASGAAEHVPASDDFWESAARSALRLGPGTVEKQRSKGVLLPLVQPRGVGAPPAEACLHHFAFRTLMRFQ